MTTPTAESYIEWGMNLARKENTDPNVLDSTIHNRGIEIARLAVRLQTALGKVNDDE